jgi:hypothetical protein
MVPLLVTSKDMLSKSLEMGVCFHRDPASGGKWRDASFTKTFERRENFFIWGNFYEEFERYVKKGPVNGQLST